MTTEQKLKEALRLITESSHDEAAVNTAQMALYEVEDVECEETPPLASASGSARLPGHKLADILVRHGVIQASAVEDPEGYDGGDTMARVAGVAIELCQLLAQNN